MASIVSSGYFWVDFLSVSSTVNRAGRRVPGFINGIKNRKEDTFYFFLNKKNDNNTPKKTRMKLNNQKKTKKEEPCASKRRRRFGAPPLPGVFHHFRVVPSFTEFYRVFPDFFHQHPFSLGFTEFYLVFFYSQPFLALWERVPSCYRVLPSFFLFSATLYWVSKDRT